MDGILLSLFKYKAWANAEMHAALEKFDAQQYPDKFLAMLQILDHAHVVDRIFMGHLNGTDTSSFVTTNSEIRPGLVELRERVRLTDNWYLDFVSVISPQRLKLRSQFTFTDGDKGSMSCEEMLLHVITHAGYHRGSVGQLMEDTGMDSPPDSLTKFLHRQEPERRLRG
ncbi:DinB family protein [Undibacterium sp. JH2W]|uniref:DinB family protein n=1 Tax=Undibacterium sp. JH2W TaxID=3413037 RepID=UPI003BF12DD3